MISLGALLTFSTMCGLGSLSYISTHVSISTCHQALSSCHSRLGKTVSFRLSLSSSSFCTTTSLACRLTHYRGMIVVRRHSGRPSQTGRPLLLQRKLVKPKTCQLPRFRDFRRPGSYVVSRDERLPSLNFTNRCSAFYSIRCYRRHMQSVCRVVVEHARGGVRAKRNRPFSVSGADTQPGPRPFGESAL